jgi:hypothetical protein
MSDQNIDISGDKEAIEKSMENYRLELIREGHFKEGSNSFDSLMSLHKHLISTPQEELEKEWKEIEDMGIEGPTVEEYFQGLDPNYLYQKGFSDGATKFKDDLIAKFQSESPVNLKGIDSNGNPVFVEIDKFSREQIIAMINEVYEQK